MLPFRINCHLELDNKADRAYVEHSTALQSHVDTSLIPSKYVERWKSKFNSLNIPTLWLGLVVDWAREEAGCSQDHHLIANCLNFIDSEAHVSISTLSQIPYITY